MSKSSAAKKATSQEQEAHYKGCPSGFNGNGALCTCLERLDKKFSDLDRSPSPEWRSAFNAALTGLLARAKPTDAMVSTSSIGIVAAAREIADIAVDARPRPLRQIMVTVLAIVPKEDLLVTVRVDSKEFVRPFDVPLARSVAKDLKIGQQINIAYQP